MLFSSKKQVTESVEDLEHESFEDILGDETDLMKISQESSYMFYQINAGMYISDILIEQQVLEGANLEPLLESFGEELIGKLKLAISMIIKKIKDFFMKLERNLQILFLNSRDFVAMFNKELMSKNDTGYEYESYRYTYSSGEQKITTIANKIVTYTTKYFGGLGNIDDLSDVELQKELIKENKFGIENVEEEKKAMLNEAGTKSFDELSKEVNKAFRGDKEEKSKFKDFNNVPKQTMMLFILSKDKLVSSIKKDEENILTYYSRVLKALDIAGKKIKEEKEYSKNVTVVSSLSNLLKYAGSILLSLSRIRITVIKEMYSEYGRILKGYLRFDPNKKKNEPNKSVLETALKYL